MLHGGLGPVDSKYAPTHKSQVGKLSLAVLSNSAERDDRHALVTAGASPSEIRRGCDGEGLKCCNLHQM